MVQDAWTTIGYDPFFASQLVVAATPRDEDGKYDGGEAPSMVVVMAVGMVIRVRGDEYDVGDMGNGGDRVNGQDGGDDKDGEDGWDQMVGYGGQDTTMPYVQDREIGGQGGDARDVEGGDTQRRRIEYLQIELVMVQQQIAYLDNTINGQAIHLR